MTRIALQDAARWSQACSVARAAPGAGRRLVEAVAVTRRAAKALVHDESSRRQRRRLARATLQDCCKMLQDVMAVARTIGCVLGLRTCFQALGMSSRTTEAAAASVTPHGSAALSRRSAPTVAMMNKVARRGGL